MRKPRDYDAELKALTDKARMLKQRKLVQLGELIAACGADALPAEELAGVLLAAVETKDAGTKEAWRKRGAAFFQRAARTVSRAARDDARAPQGGGGAAPAGSTTGAA